MSKEPTIITVVPINLLPISFSLNMKKPNNTLNKLLVLLIDIMFGAIVKIIAHV